MNIDIIMTFHGIDRNVQSSLFSVKNFMQYLKDKHKIVPYIYFVDSNPDENGYNFLVNTFSDFKLIVKGEESYWARSVCSALEKVNDADDGFIIHINSDLVLDNSINSKFIYAFERYVSEYRHVNKVFSFSYKDMATRSTIYGGQIKSLFSKSYPRESRVCRQVTQDVLFNNCATVNANFLIIPKSLAREAHSIFARFRHAYADTALGCILTNKGYGCMTTSIHAGWQVNTGKLRKYSMYFSGILCRNPASKKHLVITKRIKYIVSELHLSLFSPRGIDLFYLLKLGWLTRKLSGIFIVFAILSMYILKTIIFCFAPVKYLKAL